MKRVAIIFGALALGGCFENGTELNDADGTSGGMEDSSGSDSMSPSTSGSMPTSITQGSTAPPTDDDVGPGETDDDPGSSSGEPEIPPGEFEFVDADPEDYDQVDRMGMPAINTAVITSKDEYNTSTPADDAAGNFVPEIVANLTGLHNALDDDLTQAGLVPCLVEDCVAQAAPLVVPDTINITIDATVGFPNGRLPTDPVMDVTLAVVLLDLSAPAQDVLSLVGLNPTANDVEFSDSFPYFAEPH